MVFLMSYPLYFLVIVFSFNIINSTRNEMNSICKACELLKNYTKTYTPHYLVCSDYSQSVHSYLCYNGQLLDHHMYVKSRNIFLTQVISKINKELSPAYNGP